MKSKRGNSIRLTPSLKMLSTPWMIAIALVVWPGDRWRAEGAPAPEMQTRDAWVQGRLLRADREGEKSVDARLFSFVYGGQSSEELLATWPRTGNADKPAPGTAHSTS